MTTNRLAEAAAETAALLSDLGVPTVTEPRDLNIPGAWLAPSTIDYQTLTQGPLRVQWDLYLLAPDNGAPLDHLGAMLDKLSAAMTLGEVEALSLTIVNQSPDPLPALHLTIETEHTQS